MFVTVTRRAANISLKPGIEIGNDVMPVHAAVFDSVELGFHVCRKANVHNVRKASYEHIHNLIGDFVGDHVLAFFLDVFLVELGDDGSVSGRSADSLFFHCFNEGSICVAKGGLREFLFLLHGNFVKIIPFV